jgi:hypothetical protein
MYPHRIRLLGPWDCEPLSAASVRRFVPPARLRDAGLVDFAGTVRLVRRFGYPGRIDSYEHVWLTFAEIAGMADIALNETPLAHGATGTVEFEITELLTPRNRLEVRLLAESDTAGLPGEVALEVRRDAFLRDLAARAERDGSVHVTGRVHGSAARPLEVYLRADGQNVGYAVVAADQPFQMAFRLDHALSTVRVELVCVAECWHAVELPVLTSPIT